MAWKPLIAVAFLCNVVLGNVCMLQLAHAMAPEGARDPRLMSRVDAKDCPFLRAAAASPQKQNGCADGHCLTVPPHDVTVVPALAAVASAAVLPACPPEIAFPDPFASLSLRPLPESPPPLHAVRTVVLRR